MIRFIKGRLTGNGNGEIIIENNGIGYSVHVPHSVAEELPSVGEEIMVYTYFYVREDAMQLFGFLSREDLRMFELLLTVNGIGPKAALGILGAMSAYEIHYAVLAEDDKTISKAPGIGAKTARKLILELKDKISMEEWFGEFTDEKEPSVSRDAEKESDSQKDAVEALVVLGYSRTDAVQAVRSVAHGSGMSVEELLKQSLKHI